MEVVERKAVRAISLGATIMIVFGVLDRMDIPSRSLELLSRESAAPWAQAIGTVGTLLIAVALWKLDKNQESKTCASILAADLQWHLLHLLGCLEGEPKTALLMLSEMGKDEVVLDAALPKLGRLGAGGAANVLLAYRGMRLLRESALSILNSKKSDADIGLAFDNDLNSKIRAVVQSTGDTLVTLYWRYDVERPKKLIDAGIDLKKLGFDGLKLAGL